MSSIEAIDAPAADRPARPSDRLAQLAVRFAALRESQARYAAFTLGLFDRLEQMAPDQTDGEQGSLDDETRDLLDELVQEREKLRAEIATMQTMAEEQKSGYESELELLHHQLRDANHQIIKLRDQKPEPPPSPPPAAVTAAPPADRATVKPAAEPKPVKRNAAGEELDALMQQVRLLQQDVARRRSQRKEAQRK